MKRIMQYRHEGMEESTVSIVSIATRGGHPAVSIDSKVIQDPAKENPDLPGADRLRAQLQYHFGADGSSATSNEIIALCELVQELDLRDRIVTVDDMHIQIETAELMIERCVAD
ncbi:MAG: hypothetical protein OXE41_08995 [Gammaproteobacteria bacterium]|nr:hypothetical protein [Gammaproteobacteria bacterium]